MTSDEQFEVWWSDNAMYFVKSHGSADEYNMSRETARAAWNTRLPEEHRQACIEALEEAHAEALRWAEMYRKSAPGRVKAHEAEAQRYADALAWLEADEPETLWQCKRCGVVVSSPLTDDSSCNCRDQIYDPDWGRVWEFNDDEA